MTRDKALLQELCGLYISQLSRRVSPHIRVFCSLDSVMFASHTTRFAVACLLLTLFLSTCIETVTAAPSQNSPVAQALVKTAQNSDDVLNEVARRLKQIQIQPERPQLRSPSSPRIILDRLKKKLSRESTRTQISPSVPWTVPHSSPGSLSPEN